MQHSNIFHPPLPSDSGGRLSWYFPHGASMSLALAAALKEAGRPFLIIAPDSLTSARILDELAFFNEGATDILHFPDWETLPYDHFSPHQDIISERLSALYQLPGLTHGAVITTTSTLMQRVPPEQYLGAHSFILKTGEKLNLDILRTRLAHAGYHHVSQVREHGEFAIRGSIIDLFPMGCDQPFRVDLFDDEVESIRFFSPDSQRSGEQISEINLLPAKEIPMTEVGIEKFRHEFRNTFTGNPLKCTIYQDVSEGICPPGIEYYMPLFFEQTSTLFDYLPKNTIIVTIQNTHAKAHEFWQEIQSRYELYRYDVTRPVIEPKRLFIEPDNLQTEFKKYSGLQINPESTKNAIEFATEAPCPLEINHKSSQSLAAVIKFTNEYDGRILFCAESIGRREVLLQLFHQVHLLPKVLNNWDEFLSGSEKLNIVTAALEEGFGLDDPKLTVIAESQLYGKRVMQSRLRKKSVQDPDAIIRDLTELKINDPVVHIDHGVGRYLGLQTLTAGDQINEFLCIEYQDNVKLYVPVSSLHSVSRYTGADPENIPVNKLGTDQWSRAKRKAAEKARDAAAELLDLYARRASKPGHSSDIPRDQYDKFSASFPFEETPDQLNAIERVFADMSSDKPMDRVVCGDVGFGKTEVALRAAFIAAQNNKQTAVLVPTTLLAQQHYQTFLDRFAEWPIQVECLSRFKTKKQQDAVIARLKDGTLDIVVGTHKLLQDDIAFKRLGLIIVDEEHRFGVKQKEKLKTLRANVDILTLTATPIPRTMNMAMSGIRDLSIIATPPLRRLSVKTFVHEYQDGIVKEAIQREILRGGQVYFLHNEVATIDKKAEELKMLVGEARVTVAHGQMHERDLERIMSEFYHRHFNVLVCSTIIESGIDIPTANTIVINRADKFGIAQLHQLRGRVGRSHHQAYAYLLTPERKMMTPDALKRLEAISAFDDLGIGFTLATHDLEIRGAGELLGEEQSGEMQEVGFTLYMDLLSRAVDALKSGKEPDFDKALINTRSEIDLHITALIPETYLNDIELRLQFYKRIANARQASELDEIQVEMIDRFGLLPDPLKTLFHISELKLKADNLGVKKIDANEKGGKFEFNDQPNIKPETVIRLIQIKPKTYRFDGPGKIRFILEPHQPMERIALVEKLLEELAG
ncbi:MAG TPA: transcription-repair coupling factor [Gammaproteobacteria bacterium]|nr:transcription-repair coupling factor [Gammaproteobacteria bacterium]